MISIARLIAIKMIAMKDQGGVVVVVCGVGNGTIMDRAITIPGIVLVADTCAGNNSWRIDKYLYNAMGGG